MTAEVLAIPPIVDPDNTDFWPWSNTLTNISPLTRDQQTVVLPGVLWRARAEWPVLRENRGDTRDWRLMAAFLASLQGAAGRFNVLPVHARWPQGQDDPEEFLFDDDTGFDDGTGFIDGELISIRADVVSTKILFRTEGWDASATVLKTGDFISWANGYRRMLAILKVDAVSDADGKADLSLAFPAPEIPAAGVCIYPWDPSVTMRLIDDDQAKQSFQAYLDGQVAIEMIEAAP